MSHNKGINTMNRIPMKNSIHIRTLAAGIMGITMAAGFLPSMAGADSLTHVAPYPSYKVKSNGESYTQMGDAIAGYVIKYDVNLSQGNRIKEWTIVSELFLHGENVPDNYPNPDDRIDLSPWSTSAKYSFGNRPKSWTGTATSKVIPYMHGADKFVAMCNALAADLRDEGMSNQEIFSQDRTIKLLLNSFISVDRKGISEQADTSAQVSDPVFLVCQKLQVARSNAVNDPQGSMRVSKSEISIPPAWNGKTTICPVKVPATVKLNTSTTGRVKYRLRAATSGYVTPEYTMDIKDKVDGKWTGTAVIDIPVPLPVLNDPTRDKDGPYRGGVGGTGFAQTPGSGPDLDALPTNDGGIPAGPSGKAAEQGPSNLHSESFRVETVSPNKVVSDYAGYIVTCDLRPEGGDSKTTQGRDGAASAQVSKLAIEGQKPDMMLTPLGLSLGSGKHKWGSRSSANHTSNATAVGVGRMRNMCRFDNVAFRPFNKGTAASGPFQIKVDVDGRHVHNTVMQLAPKSGLPANSGWYSINNVLLKQGWNRINIKLDPQRTIAESDESNNDYFVNINVAFPCSPQNLAPGGKGTDSKPSSRSRTESRSTRSEPSIPGKRSPTPQIKQPATQLQRGTK
jgi:hypothetical protein